MFREIEDIVETLKNAKERGKRCSVLIGAGCSVTAGIPTAQSFVEIIKEKYPRAYDRAEEKTYPKCMAKLAISEQRDLIAGYVDQAKINWAHIALAQLVKAGYVDRILTTNFDPLVLRACSLVGVFPATYDLATSQLFEPDKVPEQAIFHLHGQRTGFILINTEEAFKKHSKLLAPIFEDAGRGRVWLVVGYSGKNDPVFDHLAKVDRFDITLYWIGYKDDEPDLHLRERLLKEDKYAFYTRGFDADDFFVTLAQRLDFSPPDFVGKPFSHLENLYSVLAPYSVPKSTTPVNFVEYAQKFIHNAVEQIEPIQTDVIQGWADLMSDDLEKVFDLQNKYQKSMHAEIADVVRTAYLLQGLRLWMDTENKSHEDLDKNYILANEKLISALQIKPDEISYWLWGDILSAWARTKTGEEADVLFKEAGEKYAEAVKIKPGKASTYNSWGISLLWWYRVITDNEKEKLLLQAKEILLQAEKTEEGIGAYNLACAYSLLEDETECLRWLENSKKVGRLPNREHLENDKDLDPVRDKQWFKDFIKDLP